MENQVIYIDGKKYRTNYSYGCIRLLSEKLGLNSPVTTLQRISSAFESMIENYGDLDERDLDQVDPNSLTFEQLDLFRDLVECAINAANPDLKFTVKNQDSWQLFINNAETCGVVMAGFFKANVPQEREEKKPVKKKPRSKAVKKN